MLRHSSLNTSACIPIVVHPADGKYGSTRTSTVNHHPEARTRNLFGNRVVTHLGNGKREFPSACALYHYNRPCRRIHELCGNECGAKQKNSYYKHKGFSEVKIAFSPPKSVRAPNLTRYAISDYAVPGTSVANWKCFLTTRIPAKATTHNIIPNGSALSGHNDRGRNLSVSIS